MEAANLSSVNQHFDDNEGIATYKSLTIAFGWSLEESQRNLQSYVNKHSDLKSVHCIGGFKCDSDGQWKYVVSLTKSVDKVEKDFTRPTSYVYSIHKGDTNNANSLVCFERTMDTNPVKHPQLVEYQWTPPSSTNVKPEIKASPKPKTPPKPVPQKSSFPKASTTSSSTVASKRQSIKRHPKSRTQTSLKFDVKKSETLNSAAPLGPSSDPLAGSDEEERDIFDGDEEVNFQNSAIRNKRRRVVFSSDEESEGGVKATQEPEAMINDGDGDDEDLIESSLLEEAAVLKTAKHKKPAKKVEKPTKKSPVKAKKSPSKPPKADKRGSRSKKVESDDGDVDNDAGRSEDEIELKPAQGVKSKGAKSSKSATPIVSDITNARRQLVTKTFMDEDGFLITEKVWEKVEGGEEPEPAKEDKPSPKTTKPNLSPVKRVNTNPKKARQVTLTSFFKK